MCVCVCVCVCVRERERERERGRESQITLKEGTVNSMTGSFSGLILMASASNAGGLGFASKLSDMK